MRQITIDFNTQTYPLFGGYVGEHNATEVVAIKPVDMSGANYSFAFMTNGEVIHSKYFSANEEIKVKLWQQLTMDNDLYVQLEAYDESGNYIGKSTTVKLMLSNSVHGVDVVADADNPDVYSEIAQNSAFRETLEDNIDTLDKLSTSDDGELLFDGSPIQGGGGGATDHANLTGKDKKNQHPISAITNLQTELDIRRKLDDEITAGDVTYQNPNLYDKSGTVKAALDEAIGFVTGDLTNTLTNLVTNSHSHGNKSVLDKFGENKSGEPIYNGKSIGKSEKPYITITGLTTEKMLITQPSSFSVSLHLLNSVYTDNEENVYELENKEIKNLWFIVDGTKVNIKNLTAYDGLSYCINVGNLLYSPMTAMLHVVTLNDLGTGSEFLSNLASYLDYEFELEIYL